MPLVVGVTFRRVGKVYYFDPGEHELHEGDFVIAETARGVEFGEVVLEPREVSDEELVAPLKKVVRVASGEDLDREATNREKEKHALEVCERKVHEHNLPMKLLDAEYAFDGSQVTFSFSADGRVDFRELVKDVASALRAKVQLHQIGVRDEAKLIGGYGTCGQPLCCSTFLSTFEPISMKMAKDQSLFLNPAKFSGCCGKLMCCLRYEHEYYKLAQKRFPAVGAILQLEQGGKGRVVDVNVINGMLTVQTEEDVQLHIPASQINLEGLCRRHGVACSMSEKGCQALAAGDYAEAQADLDDQEDEELDAELDPEIAMMADDGPKLALDEGPKWRSPRRDRQPQTQEPGSSAPAGTSAERDSSGRRSDARKPNGGSRRRPRYRNGNNKSGGNGRNKNAGNGDNGGNGSAGQ